MKRILIAFLPIALLWGISRPAYGQGCDTLQQSSSSDLVSFLGGILPNEANAECATWAINQLGLRRYEPSAPVLVRYLDFHRPLSPNEKLGIYLHPQGTGDVYPAVEALALIGVKALPAILGAIKADATSTKGRQNAVFVWMEIYRRGDEHPEGVARLKQEEVTTKNNAIKERLRWAVSTALTWCNPPEEEACRRAAGTSTP